MRTLLIASVILFMFMLIGCKKEEATPQDILVGTTWSRFVVKSPVNGKEMWYYLSFKQGNTVENYLKYNKTELVESTFSKLSYQRVSDTKLLVSNQNLKIDTIIINKDKITYINSSNIKVYYNKE